MSRRITLDDDDIILIEVALAQTANETATGTLSTAIRQRIKQIVAKLEQ